MEMETGRRRRRLPLFRPFPPIDQAGVAIVLEGKPFQIMPGRSSGSWLVSSFYCFYLS